ncbi:MAG: PLP-dependent aminotransferase family protein [Pseudomonadales bacterium]
MELTLSGRGRLADQVYQALRDRIQSGALPAGTRLPGSRALARSLGLSRGTVAAAYERLQAEGFCDAVLRSGTRVASLGEAAVPAAAAAGGGVAHRMRWRGDPEPPRYDLRAGLPNVADFPMAVWSRLARQALRQPRRELFDYPHPEGLPALRVAIAAHLRRRRGLEVSAAEVLITQGAQQAFSLIARGLLPAGVPVAVEDPGYLGFGQAARAAGLALWPVPVDGDGLQTAALARAPVSSVYVTPAHQFPTGALLSASRRRALLAWAEHRDGWIIEDDYDSEYRFSAPPMAPLKQLDRAGRVLLVGSFSKTVYPGLRLGYVVAPLAVLESLALLKNLDDAGSGNFDQAVLAAFIADGHYERHLRRGQRRHAARRAALVAALQSEFGNAVRIGGAEAGLHLVADLGLSPARERAVVAAARRQGIGLHGVGAFAQRSGAARGLVLGYARVDDDSLHEAVRILGRIVADLDHRPGVRGRH